MNDESGPRTQRAATAARHQALHDSLLAAAEAAIAAEGLATLRARALAEAVGCSVGAIYQIFPDLDALILAVNGGTLQAIDAVMQAVPRAGPAGEQMVRLADAYLDFAVAQPLRWAALFQHRMPPGRAVTDSYAEQQNATFRHIERPLALLRPELAAEERALLARTLFSAVHGVVALGLDEKVVSMPLATLRTQMREVVAAMAAGLTRG